MKKYIFGTLLMCTICYATLAQSNSKAIAAVTEQYLTLKDALVSEEFEKAKIAGAQMETLIAQVQEKEVSSAEQAHFLVKKKAAQKAMIVFLKSTNVKKQREALQMVSLSLYEWLNEFKLNNGTLYLQYCPMVGTDGAYWISNSKEIVNPYFGKTMLHCGSVEQTF